jgi:hypothetical protein
MAKLQLGCAPLSTNPVDFVYQATNQPGMPLPTSSKFKQNLVREYIPVAIAALIEPGWVLVNRLLCML